MRMEEETARGYANAGKTPSNDIVDLVHLHTALQNRLVKYFKTGPRIRAFSIGDGATHEFLSLDFRDTVHSNMDNKCPEYVEVYTH